MSGVEPIVLSIDLPVSPEQAFEAFAPMLGLWWPASTHSLARDLGTVCRIGCEPGGVIEERTNDGPWQPWGTVEIYEPGRHVRFTWHPGREPESAQWVDVRFDPIAGGARATLTHGGWEALGEIAPILRREYASGWAQVFGERYAGFVRSRAAGAGRG
jgi:uncharacterized protein YndB with AHSA1/START domain